MSVSRSSACDVTRELPPDKRLMSMDEVLACVCMSKSQVYRLINSGAFPKPVPIGRQRIGFVVGEVIAWVESRIEKREDDADFEKRRERAKHAAGGRQ